MFASVSGGRECAFLRQFADHGGDLPIRVGRTTEICSSHRPSPGDGHPARSPVAYDHGLHFDGSRTGLDAPGGFVRSISRRRMIKVGGATVLGAAFAGLSARPASAAGDTDLVVYGATAAGLMAGIQAARMGRTVVVVEPSSHVGGMTTGGLGNTDIGAPDSVGGLAAEFYRRIGQRYGITDGSPWFTFEPSVAAAVLSQMTADAGVVVRTNARLRSVTRAGNRIVSLVTVDGLTFSGRMFIDA